MAPLSSRHTFAEFCDNMGVVSHCNNRHQSLPEQQVQADLIALIRRNLFTKQYSVECTHVFGHLDDTLGFAELTLPQQLNVMADKLAKVSLQMHVTRGMSHGPSYPQESMRIWIRGIKATSSVRTLLYNTWGAEMARSLFQRRRIVSWYTFPVIAWSYVDRAMMTYRKCSVLGLQNTCQALVVPTGSWLGLTVAPATNAPVAATLTSLPRLLPGVTIKDAVDSSRVQQIPSWTGWRAPAVTSISLTA